MGKTFRNSKYDDDGYNDGGKKAKRKHDREFRRRRRGTDSYLNTDTDELNGSFDESLRYR